MGDWGIASTGAVSLNGPNGWAGGRVAYDPGGHGNSSAYHRYSIGRHCRHLTRNAASGLVLIAGGTHDLAPWRERPRMTLVALGLRHVFQHPAMQRWAQPLISAHHSYKALEIFWNYDLFSQGKKDNLWAIPALTIAGGHDPAFSFAMGETLDSHFQCSRHLHCPEAGHIIKTD